MRDPRCYSLESWPRKEGRGEKGREPIGVLQVLFFLGVQEWIPVVPFTQGGCPQYGAPSMGWSRMGIWQKMGTGDILADGRSVVHALVGQG